MLDAYNHLENWAAKRFLVLTPSKGIGVTLTIKDIYQRFLSVKKPVKFLKASKRQLKFFDKFLNFYN